MVNLTHVFYNLIKINVLFNHSCVAIFQNASSQLFSIFLLCLQLFRLCVDEITYFYNFNKYLYIDRDTLLQNARSTYKQQSTKYISKASSQRQ